MSIFARRCVEIARRLAIGLMRQLDEGESFVVTRNGVPVGELVPLRRHRFVAAEAAVALFRSAPRVDYRQFRADLDALAGHAIEPRG